MLHADPFHSYCVALVVPMAQSLEDWAEKLGISYTDLADLCQKEECVKEVHASLVKVMTRFVICEASPSFLSLSSHCFTKKSMTPIHIFMYKTKLSMLIQLGSRGKFTFRALFTFRRVL